DFGDVRTAARLIRRAKRRNRPLAWQAWRVGRYAVAGLVVLYAAAFVRFAFARPTIKVDFLAQVNGVITQSAEADRAWPIYRKAILALGLGERDPDETPRRYIDADPSQNTTGSRTLLDATPADAAWPELIAWLDAHADGLALLRSAAAKP